MIAQIANVEVKPAAMHIVAKQKREVEVVKLERVNLKSLIESMNGKFVSLDFIKIDGTSPRTLTGRLGVHAYSKGGANKTEAWDRPYLTMFDVQLRQYRNVSLDTVSAIRAVHKIWNLID